MRVGVLPTSPRRQATQAAVKCPPRTSHHSGTTSTGWEQRSFLCQAKAEGLIFICQEANVLGDFPGDSCFPRNQEWGDAIAKTARE